MEARGVSNPLMSPGGAMADKTRLFLSYSRADVAFVRDLAAALEKRNYFVDFDLGGDALRIEGGLAPTDQWWERLKENMAAADVVVFVVSPDAIASRVCADEISWAQNLRKRLVPVLWRPINFQEAPQVLAALNVAIAFSEEAAPAHTPFRGTEAALDALCLAIDHDIEWLRQGSRLTVQATLWDKESRPDAYLLRSGAISQAEKWSLAGPSDWAPPDVVVSFLHASRQKESRDRDNLRSTVARSFVEPTELALREQKFDAAIRLVAAAAVLSEDEQLSLTPDLVPPLLMAGGANRTRAIVRVGASRVDCVQFSADDQQLFAKVDRSLRRWNLNPVEEMDAIEVDAPKSSRATLASDCKTLAVVDGLAVKLFSAVDGQVRCALTGHQNTINRIAFSRSGRLVVTASGDCSARVWNAITGQQMQMLLLPGQRVTTTAGSYGFRSAEFSADERQVITAGFDPPTIWDLNTGQPSTVLKGHNHQTTHAVFSPDQSHALTGGHDSVAIVWSLPDGEKVFQVEHGASVAAVAFSPDGRRFLTASEDQTIKVWDLGTGKEVFSLVGHDGPVTLAAFSHSGGRIASYASDGLRVWDAASDCLVYRSDISAGRMRSSLAFVATNAIALVGWETGAAIIDVSTGQPIHRLGLGIRSEGDPKYKIGAKTLDIPMAVARDQNLVPRVSPDGKFLATVNYSNTVRLWEISTGKDTVLLEGHAAPINCVGFSPNGEMLVTASRDRTCKVWRRSGDLVSTFDEHEEEVITAEFSPDGELVCSASTDDTAKVWEARTGKCIAAIVEREKAPKWKPITLATGRETAALVKREKGYPTISFSSDGKHIATTFGESCARVWDVRTCREIAAFGGHRNEIDGHSVAVLGAKFCPDPRYVVSFGNENRLRVWEAQTGTEVAVLEGHRGLITGAAFTVDGRRLVSTSLDRTARIWDWATKSQIGSPLRHKNPVYSGVFDDTGTLLGTVDHNGVAQVWNVARSASLCDGPIDVTIAALLSNGIGIQSHAETTGTLTAHAPANLAMTMHERLSATMREVAEKRAIAIATALPSKCYRAPSDWPLPDLPPPPRTEGTISIPIGREGPVAALADLIAKAEGPPASKPLEGSAVLRDVVLPRDDYREANRRPPKKRRAYVRRSIPQVLLILALIALAWVLWREGYFPVIDEWVSNLLKSNSR